MVYIKCLACNLARATQRAWDLPILSHRFSKYDSQLLIRGMAERIRQVPGRFNVINKSSEENMVIYYRQFMFLDSYNWLNSSLAELIDIAMRDDKFPIEPAFPLILEQVNGCMEKYKMLCRKMCFPYTHLSSTDVMQEKHLPPKAAFYNDLKKENVREEDYNHACEIWNTFRCENFQSFLEVYLSCDVLALADLFERYRNMGMRQFSLDPVFFFSASHYSWNCMLKFTGAQIELIQDTEMWHWVRSAVRGGLTYVVRRYMKANLPHLPDYREEEASTQLCYLDCRGLYSYCLRRPLPLGNYKWLSEKKVKCFDIHCAKKGKGHILQVDVSYPQELHAYFRDLPPLPHHKFPDRNQWSSHQKRLAEITGQIRISGKTKKLIADLEPKRDYVVHIELLRICIKLGVKVDKIHRIVEFDESPWASSYIDYVEKQRQKAASLFESNYLKKANNVIFGYMLNDVTRRRRTQLITSSEKFLKLSRKPNFKRWNIYGSHLVSVEMQPVSVLMSSPIIAGFSVLDISKMHMLKVWYFLLKKIYADNIHLLMTDTDSLICGIVNDENIYEVMTRYSRYFDLSEFQGEMQKTTNSKRAGTMKDELAGRDEILEFVGLRAKSYSLRLASEKSDNKSKGIPRVVMKNTTFADYMQALEYPIPDELNKCKFSAIRSLKQKMFTVQQNRTYLSSFDDKRIIDESGIETWPYGFSFV